MLGENKSKYFKKELELFFYELKYHISFNKSSDKKLTKKAIDSLVCVLCYRNKSLRYY